MALIDWDDSLQLDIDEIDRQHKRLISLINGLHDAMRNRQADKALGGILISLINYTEVHFSTEEKYFAAFGYPETNSHKQEHKEFVVKISGFERDFREGKMMLSIDVMKFLKNWLTNHIKKSDKAYAPFLMGRI